MENRSKIIEALALGEYTIALRHYDSDWTDALLRLTPEGLRPGLIRHILRGDFVGGFLTAFLENDLIGAVSRADADSYKGMRELCQFIHNYSPRDCHGSREIVRAWQKRGGVLGPLGEEESQ